MAISIKNAVVIALTLLVIGIVVPYGLAYVGASGDMNITIAGTSKTLSEWIDPSLITLLEILVPILAIVGIALTFLSAVSD